MSLRPAFLLLFLAFPVILAAQLGGGSPYSALGIGNIDQLGWGPSRGLAGAGIGLRFDNNFTTANPASYTAVLPPANVIFTTGLSFDFNHIADQDESTLQRDGGLTHLALWIRPAKAYAFTIGVEPYSTVKYSIVSNNDRELFGENYSSFNSGSGGLARLFWGHGFQLPFGISLGANLGLIFGNITKEENLLHPDPSQSFTVATDNYLSAFNSEFGLQWETKIGDDRLVLGAAYEPKVTFNSNSDFSVSARSDTVLIEGAANDDDFSAPLNYGFGASYRRGRWMLTAEANYSGWSATDNEENATYNDSWAYTLAGEIALGKQDALMRPRNLILRAGVTFQTASLEIDGTSADELLLTTGISIPYRYGRNHIDLSYSYLHKGTLNNGLIEENRHSLGISIALRDVWFKQRKFN